MTSKMSLSNHRKNARIFYTLTSRRENRLVQDRTSSKKTRHMVRVSFFSSWSGGILYCDNGVSAVQRQTTIYVMKCVQTSTGSCKSQPIKWKLLGSNVSPRDNSVSPSKPVPKAAGALFDYVNYWTSFVPTVTRGSFSNDDGAAKENVKKASRASLFLAEFFLALWETTTWSSEI